MQSTPFRLKYVKLPPTILGDLPALKCLRLPTWLTTWSVAHRGFLIVLNNILGGVLRNNANDMETIKRPWQELATCLQGFGAPGISYKDWQWEGKADCQWCKLCSNSSKINSLQVAQQCKENIFAIQTLKDFQFVEENKDQGLNVREKAKAMVSLLKVTIWDIFLILTKIYELSFRMTSG